MCFTGIYIPNLVEYSRSAGTLEHSRPVETLGDLRRPLGDLGSPWDTLLTLLTESSPGQFRNLAMFDNSIVNVIKCQMAEQLSFEVNVKNMTYAQTEHTELPLYLV